MEATILDHLGELRVRILQVTLVFIISSFLAYPLADDFLVKVKNDLVYGKTLVVLSPQEALMVYIKISFIAGFVITLPVFAFHLFRFASPGLEKKESRLALIVATTSFVLFLFGALFAYTLIIPKIIQVLFETAIPVATPLYSLSTTTSFILSLILAMGVAFQIPLVCGLLSYLGIVDSKQLSHYRRHAIVLFFFTSALITDPSMITQVVVAAPMIILYELGIISAKILEASK